MSDVYQALNDVRWLSDRLKGLMTLGQEIESYDALKDQTAEMAITLDKSKAEIAELQAEVVSINKSKQNLEEEISQIKKKSVVDYDQDIAKAKADADTIRQNAEADAQSLREAATADVSATNAKIADAKIKLKDLTDKIDVLTDTHNRLQSAIDTIKARF